jgi:cell division protein FtsB
VTLETFIDNTARKLVEEELQAAYSQLTATEKELKKKFEELQKSKDIGEHYTAEQALRECEERLKNLMEKKSV